MERRLPYSELPMSYCTSATRMPKNCGQVWTGGFQKRQDSIDFLRVLVQSELFGILNGIPQPGIPAWVEFMLGQFRRLQCGVGYVGVMLIMLGHPVRPFFSRRANKIPQNSRQLGHAGPWLGAI